MNLSRAVQSLNIYDNDALDKEEKAWEENWERDISTENDFETDADTDFESDQLAGESLVPLTPLEKEAQEADLSKSQSSAADKSSSSDGKSHVSEIKKYHVPTPADELVGKSLDGKLLARFNVTNTGLLHSARNFRSPSDLD